MSSSTRTLSSSRRFADGRTTQAGSAAPSRNATTAKAKPNCTHPTVDRLYGPFSCDLCHKSSPLQWLYLCTHDSCNDYRPSPVDSVFSNISVPETGNVQDDLRALGFSESILQQAEAGVYTPQQINILKKQKLNLAAVIAGSPPVSPKDTTTLPTKGSDFLPRWDNPIARKNPHPAATTPTQTFRPEPCRFKTCHRCRPYLCDRSWASFEAVYLGEARPLTMVDRYTLPIKDARIARTLGLQRPATPTHNFPYTETTPTSATSNSTMDSSDYSSDWEDEFDSQHHTDTTGTTFIYSQHRRAYTPTLRRVSRSISDTPSLSSASTNSLRTLATSSTARTSPLPLLDDEEEFDLSLATGRSKPRSEMPWSAYRPHNLDAVVLQKSSEESLVVGAEMEVEGGVALTEEAVRTHTPDILTRV